MSAPILAESARREEILSAARTIFAHYGFRRASLEEVARETGTSRTALYHHFRNKEDIFRATCEGIYGEATERARRAANSDARIDTKLLEVLDALVGSVFRLLASSRHGLEIVDESNRLCADITASWMQHSNQLVAGILRDAETRGELDTGRSGHTPQSAAEFLLLCAHGLQGPTPTRTPSASQYNERLSDLVRLSVTGLGGTTTSMEKGKVNNGK